MPSHNPLPFALSFMGATGTGKTQLAITIAEQCYKKNISTSIINMDSRQVYREFPIISAQPSSEEKSLYPHLLYSYLQSNETIMVGKYIKEVYQEILNCHKKNTLPILVGGTGLYFKALFSGLAPIPDIEESIRNEQREKIKKDISSAYNELYSIDPKYASSIHSNDSQRIARALEVFYQTQKTLSYWHTKRDILELETLSYSKFIPLTTLEKLLVKRIDNMMNSGALEEVEKALHTNNFNIELPGWSCIGAKELAKYILNMYTKEEAVKNWEINTRAYAKRQITWFKAQKDIYFFSEENTNTIGQEIMKNIIKRYIN